MPIHCFSSNILFLYSRGISKHTVLHFNLLKGSPFSAPLGHSRVNDTAHSCFDGLTCLDSFPMKCQRTEFLEMSELGLYQACNTTIWPLTTSISLLGNSTFRVSPGTTTQSGTQTVHNNCDVAVFVVSVI